MGGHLQGANVGAETVFTLQKPVGPGPEIEGPLCDLNGGSHGTEFSFI